MKAAPEGGGLATSQSLSEFTRVYREWITFERPHPNSPETRVEKSRLLVYTMVGAATLLEALEIYVRFAKLVWGERGPKELRDEGESIALVFEEPLQSTPEGLINAIWPLSLTLTELEFLAGGQLTSVTGRVRNALCLPESTASLLFDRPLTYAADDVALVLPKRQLKRPIMAKTADIPEFFRQLLPASLGAAAHMSDMRSLLAGLIRNDRLKNSTEATDLETFAARLGCSAATLRRRLRSEGASFREIRDAVFDELAKAWLVETEEPIDRIAERLGYSDGFAFRRAFRRQNGFAPLAYRRSAAAHPDREPDN